MRMDAMKKEQRWSQIVEYCKSNPSSSVDDLVNYLHVSAATVRRDLSEMEEQNMIVRYHGGARINSDQYNEPSMILKTEANIPAKKHIALLAAQQIEDNQMIYIDAGSTTYAMIPFITARNITVVTPGIPHLALLGGKGISTIVLGGVLRWSTQAITGQQAVHQMEDLYFDECFIGTNAIHEQIGFSTSNEMEAATKAAAIHHSKTSFILADHTKFNKLNPVPFASRGDAIILCDDLAGFPKNKIHFMTTAGETSKEE